MIAGIEIYIVIASLTYNWISNTLLIINVLIFFIVLVIIIIYLSWSWATC